MNNPKIVLIGELKKEHISEEAGHFLHFSNAKIKFSERDKLNTLGLNIKKLLRFTACQKPMVFEHCQKYKISEALKGAVCLGFIKM